MVVRKRSRQWLRLFVHGSGGAKEDNTVGVRVSRAFGITVCLHLSERSNSLSRSSKTGGRDGDVDGRELLVCDFLGDRPRLRICKRCGSSNIDNSAFSHTSFREVVSSVSTKGMGYIVIGSRSHFKHSCVRIKGCGRGVFPRGKIHFVTVGRNCSSTSTSSSSSVTFAVGDFIRSFCVHSVSGGVESRLRAGVGGNRCASGFIIFKCAGSPRGGGGLVVSPCTTRIIQSVFD